MGAVGKPEKMTGNKPSVLCIGGLHWDTTLQCLSSLVWGESNPVSTHRTPGGVAANLAANLSSLGFVTGLASRVGCDPAAAELKHHLVGLGIETSLVEADQEAGGAAYTTFLSPEGEVVVGGADMAPYDQLDERYWRHRHELLTEWDLWCIDSNIPQSGIAYLVDQVERARVIAVAASPAKVVRFKPVLSRIGTLVLNLAEAGELIGRGIDSLDGASGAAIELVGSGVGRVFVTAGSEGAAWATSIEEGVVSSPPLCRTNSFSGAGDAFAAAAVAAIALGESEKTATAWGIGAAAIVAGSTRASASLSWDQIVDS